MASRKFLIPIDMGQNQIENVVLHNLAADPISGIEGQKYWNTVNKLERVYTGTTWLNSANAGNSGYSGSTSSTAALVIDDANTGNVLFSIADVVPGGNSGLISGTDATALQGADTTATADTLAKRTADGSLTATNFIVTNAPTLPGHAASKSYVDTLIASGMRIKGVTDASVNPDYPVALTGDAYSVSVAGNIGGATGPLVQVGDLILCVADSAVAGNHATVGSNFIVLQKNIDNATTLIAGTVRFATSAEITTGTTTVAVPSVADVASMVANAGGHTSVTLTLGATSYNVNHALGGDVIVQVMNITTGEIVETGVTKVDVNNTTITVTTALAVDHKALFTLA